MGTLMHVARVGDNPFFVSLGVEPTELAEAPPAVIEGTMLKRGEADQILLGERAATDLGIGVGDSVEIEDRELTVTGVFESDNAWEASGGYVPLPTVQEIARKPGLLTAVYVKAAPDADPAELQASIERRYPQLTAISDVEDYGDVDQGIELLDAANLAISLLAVGIGAIGVMNTMVMSVFERTREFGILRAVGWRGRRIIRMVILESLLLCLIAALLGTALGVLATRALLLVPAIGSFLDPQYSPEVFVRALLVGVVVALAGAAYPAFRAVRLTPMEALRHE
jgi:putative ABC transport system permease protein